MTGIASACCKALLLTSLVLRSELLVVLQGSLYGVAFAPQAVQGVGKETLPDMR